MHHRLARLILLAVLAASCVAPGAARAEDAYQPNWTSLRTHTPAPEWFRDAKYGIYFHWGVYSVPAYGNEWYPRFMHAKKEGLRNHHYYKHHTATYGDPAQYGYDRFVEGFTAEKFDADDWADLFAKSGAKFAGPVAEHHDGFAMWDSELTPWNAADRGPKRDITGEMAAAVRKRGMKLITSFHHARNNLWEKRKGNGTIWSGHYSHAKEFFPTLLEDQERAILYGYMPRQDFLDMWLGKLDEVIGKYSPDIIWFDSWLDEIPDTVQQQFLANYFNHAAENGKEVLVTYKQEDMPQDIAVLDLEKGGMGELTEFAWLTDDTISLGSWCYTENLRIKPTHVVVHSLIDIVSKNGQLLLNISPKADGSIPQEQRDVLLGLGAWLDAYGEAIYETRPFTTYGHGPTKAGKGHFGGIATDIGYTADDIRYTRKGTTVYAIQLGAPEAGSKTTLSGFAGDGSKVASVELLGSDAAVEWEMTDAGLVVTAPAESPDSMAIVYKVATE